MFSPHSCELIRLELLDYMGSLCLHVYMLSCFSRAQPFATLWTVACQAPLSMEFSRQKYWEGCHALLQGIFLTQELNLSLLCLPYWQVRSLPLVPPGKPMLSFVRKFCVILIHVRGSAALPPHHHLVLSGFAY